MILSIETSSTACSVALHHEGELVKTKMIIEPKAHSNRLIDLTKELFQEAGAELKDLNAVAVSEGPGSYTGLRIGASTAKGFCFALDIPLISIGSLATMAAAVEAKKNEVLCPMIDARRMEVYSALYGGDLTELKPAAALILDENPLSDWIGNGSTLVMFGDGSEKAKPLFENESTVRFVDNVHALASNMGALAWQKFENQQFEDVAYFEPFYLKEFLATTPKKRI